MKKIIAILAVVGVALSTSACSSFTDHINNTYHSAWSPVESYGEGARGGATATAGISGPQATANHGHSHAMATCGCVSARGSNGNGSGNGGHGSNH
jgi:hypothetical protein